MQATGAGLLQNLDCSLPERGKDVPNVGRVVRLPDGVVVDGERVLLRRPDDHRGVVHIGQKVGDLVAHRHRDHHVVFVR